VGRWLGHAGILSVAFEAILQAERVKATASCGEILSIYILSLVEIPFQGAGAAVWPVVVGMKEVLNQRSNTLASTLCMYGGSRCVLTMMIFLVATSEGRRSTGSPNEISNPESFDFTPILCHEYFLKRRNENAIKTPDNFLCHGRTKYK
jgi:hypothetical protein